MEESKQFYLEIHFIHVLKLIAIYFQMFITELSFNLAGCCHIARTCDTIWAAFALYWTFWRGDNLSLNSFLNPGIQFDLKYVFFEHFNTCKLGLYAIWFKSWKLLVFDSKTPSAEFFWYHRLTGPWVFCLWSLWIFFCFHNNGCYYSLSTKGNIYHGFITWLQTGVRARTHARTHANTLLSIIFRNNKCFLFYFWPISISIRFGNLVTFLYFRMTILGTGWWLK